VTEPLVDHRINSRRSFSDSASTLESYDNHTEFSDWGDVISPGGYFFALRYAYSQFDSTAVSKTGVSRDFCQNMVALSEEGVQYRYEDIADMSADGINGEFAAKGESTYDIFEWKGGKNCYHWWDRLIYIYAPEGDAGEPWEGDIPAADEWDEVMMRVGNNPYVPQPGVEGIAPIEMQ
jgi:hypothetical protein